MCVLFLAFSVDSKERISLYKETHCAHDNKRFESLNLWLNVYKCYFFLENDDNFTR